MACPCRHPLLPPTRRLVRRRWHSHRCVRGTSAFKALAQLAHGRLGPGTGPCAEPEREDQGAPTSISPARRQPRAQPRPPRRYARVQVTGEYARRRQPLVSSSLSSLISLISLTHRTATMTCSASCRTPARGRGSPCRRRCGSEAGGAAWGVCRAPRPVGGVHKAASRCLGLMRST